MPDISRQLTQVRQQIADAAATHNRNAHAIRLLAVSKTQPLEKLRAAIAAGQTDFGENYLQEALEKISALQGEALTWHFIGPIQSNKTRDIAAHFDWVHSVDRLKIARRLSQQRPSELPPLNICIQVNISDEASKAGVATSDVNALAEEIAALPQLKLRGLMAIPAATENTADQRRPFAALREVFEHLNAAGLALDTLSMGMTNDLSAAIAEGATMVRIGTAIFGDRLI